jgi:RecA-family ATPase
MNAPLKLVPMDLMKALGSPPPAHDFVLPGMVRGTVSVVPGAGGTGKSYLLLEMAVSQALGLPTAGDLFPAPPTPRKVAFLTAEDPEPEVTIRLHWILGDVLAVHGQMHLSDEPRVKAANALVAKNLLAFPCGGLGVRVVSGLEQTRWVDEIVSAAAGCELVVMETASRLHDGNENETAAVAMLMDALEVIAKRLNAAVILVHHIGKEAARNGNESSQYAVRGSSAFVDNARYVASMTTLSQEQAAVLGLSGVEKEFVRYEVVKASYTQAPGPRILRRLAGGVLRTVALAPPPGVAKAAPRRKRSLA